MLTELAHAQLETMFLPHVVDLLVPVLHGAGLWAIDDVKFYVEPHQITIMRGGREVGRVKIKTPQTIWNT